MAIDKETTQKNLQLVDLGLERRFEITTADDKRDPYAQYNEQDLEAFRKSVQNRQTAQLQRENQDHLNAWSNFHETVKDIEGDLPEEPQLMNGQSHRAHLHFEMRNLEASRKPFKQNTIQGPSHPRSVPFSGKPNKQVLPQENKGPTATLRKFNKQDTTTYQHNSGRRPAPKIRRRPARPPLPSPPVDLADPSSWIDAVRGKTSQSGTDTGSSASRGLDTSRQEPKDRDTAEPSTEDNTEDNVFRCLQEVGYINDALADLDLTDLNERRELIDKKNELVAKITAFSKKRIAVDPIKTEEPRTANDSRNYWQKTLPKLPTLTQVEPAPENVPKEVKSSSSNKVTKSLYESRYAC